jgi:hypothetical protein
MESLFSLQAGCSSSPLLIKAAQRVAIHSMRSSCAPLAAGLCVQILCLVTSLLITWQFKALMLSITKIWRTGG